MTDQPRGQDQGQRQQHQTPLTLDPTRLGLPGGPVSDPAAISDCLLKTQATCNVLAPAMTIDYLPPDHVISFMVVLFPTDGIKTYKREGVTCATKQQSNGVWYATDGGQLAMHRSALDMLAQAAGITWVFDGCGRTDDRRTSLRWAYRMTCEMKGLDGKTRQITREYELDLRDNSPAAEKAGKGIRNARIHGAQLCESKAANRCIRAALGIRAYTVDEARRPFVFPLLRWVPPMNDPVIRRLIAAKELGVISELFGAEANATADMVRMDRKPNVRQLEDGGDSTMSDWEQQAKKHQERAPVTAERGEVYNVEQQFESGGTAPWDEDPTPQEDHLQAYCEAKGWKFPTDDDGHRKLVQHVQGKGKADYEGFLRLGS